MGASSGALYRVGAVNVTNGSKNITGVSTSWLSALIAIATGDLFTLDMKTWYEVVSINTDTGIVLDRNFEGGTASGVNYAIIRNTSGTVLTRIAGQIAVQFNQKQLFLDELRTWLNSTNTTENVTDSHGLTHAITTPTQSALNASTALAAMDSEYFERLVNFDALTGKMYDMTIEGFNSLRAKNNAKYAASGFVHMGQHLDQTSFKAINQGLFTNEVESNVLGLGRTNKDKGISKVSYPVLNIAGIETDLIRINKYRNNANHIKFPSAPNGTVTYDSATGVITDYMTDIDAKYGDVALTVNEGVARAFEGAIPNGDFRLGDTWNGADIVTMLNGTMTVSPSANWARAYIQIPVGYVPDSTYILKFDVKNIVQEAILDIASGNNGSGIYERIRLLGGEPDQTISIEVTPTHATLFYLVATGYLGGSYNIANVSLVKKTTEVVTERVDMYGFEGYLEEVTTTNPYVYPNGLIQSQATTMDGVTTSASNRPVTYYAVFDGDTGSVGKGVDWFSASDGDKQKMLGNPKNNLYWIEGKLYQWRVRQRTIAGAGNGDWLAIDSTGSGLLEFNSALPTDRLAAQGIRDTATQNGGRWYAPTEFSAAFNGYPHVGLFTVTSQSLNSVGAFGQAYFLVCGTVPRLNQGAFHPSFNAFGTTTCNNTNADSSVWSGVNTIRHTGVVSCFNYFINVNNDTDAGAYSLRGKIGSISGRPDGKFYDAIYASGQGGILDYRLSAWDKSSPSEAAKVDALVKNGSYRGVEKLVRTKLEIHTNADFTGSFTTAGVFSTYGTVGLIVNSTLPTPSTTWSLPPGTYQLILTGDNGAYHVLNAQTGNDVGGSLPHSNKNMYFNEIYNSTGEQSAGVAEINTKFPTGTTISIYKVQETEGVSVSGEFTQTTLYGEPSHILASNDFKDGWLGSWGGLTE